MKRGGANHQPPDFMALFYVESLYLFVFLLYYIMPALQPFCRAVCLLEYSIMPQEVVQA
jgi:hypothetical protein